MTPPHRHPLVDSGRAWFMLGVGTLTYASAVLQRTSFGVAGVYATERFQTGASIVALFVVVQLATYAAMQVPVGVLTDRFGSRAVAACGALLMCLGQIDLAFSSSLVSAVIARVLVGAGDAMTFSAVIRILPAWFSSSRVPVLVQVLGMLGQTGQLLSSIPLAAMLRTQGWTRSFAAAGVVSGLVAAIVVAMLRDAPPGVRTTLTTSGVTFGQQIAQALRQPGTRLGFWIHWVCGFWGQVFAFMWGYPFLTQGLGYSPEATSLLFTVFVVAGFPLAPLIGLLSRSAPSARPRLALLLSAAMALLWLTVLAWPGVAPPWLLTVLLATLSASGPASMIGVDVARAANPPDRIGTATGIVIVGGFVAGLAAIWVAGVVLDLAGGLSLVGFRRALATQFVLFAIGCAGVLWESRKLRRSLAGT